MSLLLIDAGNTRIKWAIAQADSFNLNDKWVKSGHINYADLNESALSHITKDLSSIKKLFTPVSLAKKK